LANHPLALCFLSSATSNSLFVFGLVEVTFRAFGTARAWVDAKVFAEMLIAFLFFKFIVFQVFIVEYTIKPHSGKIISININMTPSAVTIALWWPNGSAKGFPTEVTH
jgi:hypothetical protein